MSDVATTSRSRLERLFRRSSYLTLLLACASLTWAEWDLVPDIRVVAVATLPILILAYVLEGRWTLSTWLANVLGLAIAAVLVARLLMLILAPTPQGVLATMPWPASMVPLLGPLLLLLVAAKLLRPKSNADYWGLYGMGLGCVGLSCVLAPDDELFPILLMAYLLSAIWCLGLFFLVREPTSVRSAEPAPTPRPHQVLAWAMPILIIALTGFMTLPRSGAIWEVPRQARRLETGSSEDTGLDLNHTGTITLNADVAFEVVAEDNDGTPKTDLPRDQRWRGPVYRYYYDGAWRRSLPGTLGPMRPMTFFTTLSEPTVSRAALPNLGDDQFFLTFTTKKRLGSVPFLADPIYRTTTGSPPVISLPVNGGSVAWTIDSNGMPIPGASIAPGRGRYRQVTLPPKEVGLGPEVNIPSNRQVLTQPADLPGFQEWTEQLLRRLVDEQRLPVEAIQDRDVDGNINPRFHETVARALEQYLAHSGEYTYSLDLTRTDEHDPEFQADPTLDFLFNTKSGHCNRFASALAIMLRSLRIPCHVVRGYRGVDPSDVPGLYIVRECYAHSWVEVLVHRRGDTPAHEHFAGRDQWHWLTLDPTPTEAGFHAEEAANRWWGVDVDLRRLYRELILDFTAENRNDLLRRIAAFFGNAASAIWQRLIERTDEGFRARIAMIQVMMSASVTGMILVRWSRRRWLRWRRGPGYHPGTAFLRRMLAILARRGLRPTPRQTPREFAFSVSQELPGNELSRVVHDTVDLYYRVRFGSRPASSKELAEINSRLNRLAAALSARN